MLLREIKPGDNTPGISDLVSVDKKNTQKTIEI